MMAQCTVPKRPTNDYLEEITKLLERVRPKLAAEHRLELKRVFGAVGGYVNGNIFISCGKFGIALRLPPKILDRLFREIDVAPLRYFAKGHIKKQYAVIPQRLLKDKREFGKLLDESISFLGLHQTNR